MNKELMHLAFQGNSLLLVQILILAALMIELRVQLASHALEGTWLWEWHIFWTHLNASF
jgi:hypothetical protein